MDPACYRADLIELLQPAQLLIVWGDGHESLYPHRWLRQRCQCARCVDEWNGRSLLDPSSIAADLSLRRWEATGRYGMNLHFSDGHATGIFTYQSLRDACPCPECLRSTVPEVSS